MDGSVFPLSIRDGLPYGSMRPYNDTEFESSLNVDWDPCAMDFDVEDDEDWYDAILDNIDHSVLFDEFGNYTRGTHQILRFRALILGMTLSPGSTC